LVCAGLVALPQIGAAVWVEFEQGDPERPIWSGGFWQMGACPSALVPLQTLLQTATGHSILIDDTPGTGGISLTTLTGDTLKLSTATGALLQTVLGHKIEINPAGITLQTVTRKQADDHRCQHRAGDRRRARTFSSQPQS
jgi:uncharacterized protein involved in type VI secretion and phage assembly